MKETIIDRIGKNAVMTERRGVANGKDGMWFTIAGNRVFVPDDPDVDPIGPGYLQGFLKSVQKEGPLKPKPETPNKVARKPGVAPPPPGPPKKKDGILSKIGGMLSAAGRGVKKAAGALKRAVLGGDKKEVEEARAHLEESLREFRSLRRLYEDACAFEGAPQDSALMEACDYVIIDTRRATALATLHEEQ